MNKNKHLTAATALLISIALISASGCGPAVEVPPIVSTPATAAESGLQDFYAGSVTGSYLPPNDLPQNPYLATGRNGIHEATYNSDVTETAGPQSPTGSMSVISHQLNLLAAACPTILFDAQNRVIANCISFGTTTLYLLDPTTLKILAQRAMPPKTNVGLDGKSDASGGGYSHMTASGQLLIGPFDRHLQTFDIVETDGNFSFQLDQDFDLTPHIVPTGTPPNDATQRVTDTLLDYQGRNWFTTNTGIIGYVDHSVSPPMVNTYDFGENLQNQVAIDATGVYVVTWTKMHKVAVAEAGDVNCPSCSEGDIYQVWEQPYDVSAAANNPGLVSPGSGTSPTLFGENDDIIAIADNAAPVLHINLYDRTSGDLICSHPTFTGGGAENSPSGYGDEIVLSNNGGYGGVFGDPQDLQPGLIKVKVNAARTACTTEWERYDFKGTPSPFLSTDNGTIYTYAIKAGSNGADAWYLTAVDWASGEIIYQKYVGSGSQFDNILQPVTVSPDGGAYISVKNGIVLVRDI